MELEQGSGFAKFSTEIIWAIIGFIPPASHLDFACTCKHIAHCSSDVLKRHRYAYECYRVSSDLDPATVPTLLQSVFGPTDPIKAWHVRSFEVWRDRNCWQEWQTYDLRTSIEYDNTNPPESRRSCIGRDTSFSDFGLDTLSHEQHIAAITEIEEGHDGVLKALLLANLPRLRDIKFITQAHDQRSTLSWLSTFIANKMLGMGLESLVSVAVGIPSNTWMDDSNDPTLPAQIFATLLTLPNIESIYYNDLVSNEADDFDWKAIIPDKSSNVKHIFLDDCNNIPYELQGALAASPKSLVSMSFRAGTGSGDRMDDVDRIVSFLSDSQSISLDSLMFYGYRDDNLDRIHGYRCTVYRPEELNNLTLKNVSLAIEDIELDALYHCDDDQQQSDTEFWKDFVVNILPQTMETLTLWGEPGSAEFGDDMGDTDYVEAMVIALLESEEFPDLSAIYLEEVERRGDGRQVKSPRADKIAFQRAIEVGQRQGVDVHTITNRRTSRNEQIFPEAPDAYDLVTGPHEGKRPPDFIFDVYQGRRVPLGCGKCGKCDNCLANYTKELWDMVPSVEDGE